MLISGFRCDECCVTIDIAKEENYSPEHARIAQKIIEPGEGIPCPACKQGTLRYTYPGEISSRHHNKTYTLTLFDLWNYLNDLGLPGEKPTKERLLSDEITGQKISSMDIGFTEYSYPLIKSISTEKLRIHFGVSGEGVTIYRLERLE